ncbi:sigma-70 family RNA polymerase sigma factor [Defluviimonas sp. WL0002]|uniref:Sigma-70 family RNA polymerase sigma factor n=2 Tax=Albidovulum marisflavi TaxID=2984159 RepID=A0ABT2ZGU7_9RHOB|nr:sigma-70 family RNA polymerase sigma factor [Defluviimonas sp. WL0002]
MTEAGGAEISPQTAWMIAVRDRRDRAAFARLFDYYAPRLKSVTLRSGTPAAEAEDIVQDVMLAVWHKASQYDPARADVSGWIYRIARNRQIDLARRKARPEPEDLMLDASHAPEADQIVAMAQEAGELRRALGQLAPEQKRLIEKAYLGDMSHVEIREDTGLPLGTIKSRIRLGLERLRYELKELRKT